MEIAALSALTAFDERLFVWLNPYLSRWPLLNLFLRWLLDAHIVKFVPIVLVNIIMGANTMINTRDVIQGADRIPLDSYGATAARIIAAA